MWYFGSEVVKIDPAGHFVFSGVRGSRSCRSLHRRRGGEDRAPEERTRAAANFTHEENPIKFVQWQFSAPCLMAWVFVVCCVACQGNRLLSVWREIKLHTVSHLRVGGPQWNQSLRWWRHSPRSTGWTQGLVSTTADGLRLRRSGKRSCISICVRTLWCFLSPNLLPVPLSSPAMMPEPVHSFQGQKFHKLRRACLHRGVLFRDPLFPATAQSLFYKREPPPGLTWKRPKVRWNWADGVETNRGRIQIWPQRDK